MNKEPLKSPLPVKEPMEKDEGGNTEKKSTEDEIISKAAPPQWPSGTSNLYKLEMPSPDPVQENPGDEMEDTKAAGGEPPVGWFEPLEEDDDVDSMAESMAGESERSENTWVSDKTFRNMFPVHAPRRRRAHPDEGWAEWPVLGKGWKRKEVVRRSGSSIGQKDVYYMGPQGDRVRSRVELLSVLNGILDLSTFDYKTGQFCDIKSGPIRVRSRKRWVRERSSSESSWMERGEGADTPDSYHRLTPSQGPKNYYNLSNLSSQSTTETPNQRVRSEHPSIQDRIKLPPLSSSSRRVPIPSINGEIGSEDNTLICAKCGVSFTGTSYDKQRKKPCCPTCWTASKSKEHPMIRFRKWIPCGQCVGCHNPVNCGQCANCKHGLQSPESRKRICRKRKCICPIRKGSGGSFVQYKGYDIPDKFIDSMTFKAEVTDSQYPSFKSSDTENFSVNVDLEEDEDLSTDDDDDWHKKRKRRSCGECKACLCRKDCGTCDFCVDKPKFGGSNKKRQKCRLRQCQRQAMMGQGEHVQDGAGLPGRARPHYTYSRKSTLKGNKGSVSGLEFTDNEDEDSNPKLMNHEDYGQQNGLSERELQLSNHNSDLEQLGRWDAENSRIGRDGQKHLDEDEEEEFPMITQIFSLAENPSGSTGDIENHLMKLLNSLRATVLPILWYAIMVDGPQLQLIQCSKQSNMTDTIVLIDPGFYYQITVQKQPLLPTHPLYEEHPGRLSSVTEVVDLLLALEKYVVCQGLPLKQHLCDKDPLILERAATCDFLVKRKEGICCNCRMLQGF